jgi:redox-sensitive bicupin YhaK (pirin superfamily)
LFGVRARVLRAPRCPTTNGGGAGTIGMSFSRAAIEHSSDCATTVRPARASPAVRKLNPPACSSTIHQDAHVSRVRLKTDETITHELTPGRGAWPQIPEGALTSNGAALANNDGASTETPVPLTFTATQPVEAMLFDLQAAHRRARYFFHIPIQFLLHPKIP